MKNGSQKYITESYEKTPFGLGDVSGTPADFCHREIIASIAIGAAFSAGTANEVAVKATATRFAPEVPYERTFNCHKNNCICEKTIMGGNNCT
ncbi:hypothetical protein [Cohnella sp.]|uniref:hypothetical protein n=1 Tax=Cohnella sp. TaxID=1883426 RepID=UPI00257AAC9F|nr:hypothetical protein [Cohnella sp.]